MFSKVRNTIAVAATVAALATSASALPAKHIPDTQAVKNIVLVHGAFADGAGWRGVYDDLKKRGYRVTMVQNPLTSLADDVVATKRILARQKGPSILVGHSYGGVVITEAGVDPGVAGLVYVSAFAPDVGESIGQKLAEIPSSPEFVIDPQADGYGFVSLEKFQAGFAADTSDADSAFLADSQVPIALSIFGTKLTQAAWRTKPSWAVVATEDRAIDPKLLHQMAARAGAVTVDVKASHVVYITQARAVADVIDRAARATSQTGAYAKQ